MQPEILTDFSLLKVAIKIQDMTGRTPTMEEAAAYQPIWVNDLYVVWSQIQRQKAFIE